MNKSFLDMEPPPGYVAGVGRGATGFTTRSDLGSAVRPGETGGEEGDKDRFADANDQGLFANSSHNADDKEAEQIFKNVDDRMKERRKAQREVQEQKEREQVAESSSQLASQFSTEKRGLGEMTMDDWAAIPEAVDITRRNKRRRQEMLDNRRTYATPDSLIAQRLHQNQMDSAISANEEAEVTDFRALSDAKGKVLSMKLNQLGDGANNNNDQVDANSYAKSLDSQKTELQVKEENDKIQDIAKSRDLLKALIKAKPNDATAYISLAKLEESENRIPRAKQLLADGRVKCSKDDAIWLESIRLDDRQNGKILAGEGLECCPGSGRLWIKAKELEDTRAAQVRVMQRAVQNNPNNETLWMELIGLHTSAKEAKQLMRGAVEMVPKSESLWLALARLEKPKEAKAVLERARKALRTSRAVWIAAAQLEEEAKKSSAQTIDAIMVKAVEELNAVDGLPSRETWLNDARNEEREGHVLTCHAIIKATVGQHLENDDCLETWRNDAKISLQKGGYIETARAVLAHAINKFPASIAAWQDCIDLERLHGSLESLVETLDAAVVKFPTNESFWLLYVAEAAKQGNARQVLARAFKTNPDSEQLWLAAVQIEADGNEIDKARSLLKVAREKTDSQRVWVKSVLFERRQGQENLDMALELAKEGLVKHPDCAKLYMQLGQIHEQRLEVDEAQQVYTKGTRMCRHSVPLWILSANSQLNRGMTVKARTVLDNASLVNETSDEIWLARVKLERYRAQNEGQANLLMSKALQACPTSGVLWAERLMSLSRLERKSYIPTALKSTDNSPLVQCTAGRALWDLGKIGPAIKWFDKAVEADPKLGDLYLWYYKCLYSTPTTRIQADEVLNRAVANKPDHGPVWTPVAKSLANQAKSIQDIFILALNEL